MDFKGVVDLISKEAIVWNEEDKGMSYETIEIPAELIDVVNEKRGELIEAVAEYDETLMEKFFEDEDSITEDEIIAALRAATIDMSIIPMMCGSAFKNKGVQAMLDAVMRYLPSPMDVEAIEGTNPDTGNPDFRKPTVSEPFSALAFKIATDPFVGRLFLPCVFRCIGCGFLCKEHAFRKERAYFSDFPDAFKQATTNRSNHSW